MVLPCLNEAATVGQCVREARRALEEAGVAGEVVVADNGSSDGSRRAASAAGGRVVRVPIRGYGAALAGGIGAARGRWILMADADLSYDFSSLPAFVRGLRQGFDLVQGSRLKGRILKGAMPWSHRWIGTPFFNLMLWLLFGVRVSDSQCGMRAFTRRAFSALSVTATGMEFASEMLIKAGKAGLRVCEVPIVYRPDGRHGPPHLRAFVDGWRHLRLMLLSSPGWLLWGPGAALLLAGAGLVLLALLQVRILGHSMGFHFSILGSALALIGAQIMHLGLCVSFLHKPSLAWRRALAGVFSLERLLVVGAGLVLGGLAADLAVLSYWLEGAYSAFSTTMTNLGIVGTALILLGVQVMLSGFFLSVLIGSGTGSETSS